MYQVMERGGVSLRAWRMVRSELTFTEVLFIGKSLISNLIKLHSYGIIHGDLHWENVLITPPSPVNALVEEASAELLLIDFDRSYIMGHGDPGKAPRTRAFEFFAPNEFPGGEAPSMGTDIFRAYEVMMGLMKPRYFEEFAKDGEKVALEKKLKNRLGKEDGAILRLNKKFGDKLHELVVKGLDGRKFSNLKSIIEHEEKVVKLIDEKITKLNKKIN